MSGIDHIDILECILECPEEYQSSLGMDDLDAISWAVGELKKRTDWVSVETQLPAKEGYYACDFNDGAESPVVISLPAILSAAEHGLITVWCAIPPLPTGNQP